MLAAVVLNMVSFLAIMGPAWDNVGEGGTGSYRWWEWCMWRFGRFNDTCQFLGVRHLACADSAFAVSETAVLRQT